MDQSWKRLEGIVKSVMGKPHRFCSTECVALFGDGSFNEGRGRTYVFAPDGIGEKREMAIAEYSMKSFFCAYCHSRIRDME